MVTSNATRQSLTLNFHVEVPVPNYSDTPILQPSGFIYLQHHTYVNLRELFDKENMYLGHGYYLAVAIGSVLHHTAGR
jgi:hypothetical protein